MSNSAPNRVFQRYGIAGLGLLLYACYLLGTLFPDYGWATHWLAFLSPFLRYGFLLVSGGLILYPFFNPEGISLPDRLQQVSDQYGRWIILAAVLLTGLWMYHFPIVHDYYGDSFKLLPYLTQQISSIPPGTHEAFFRFGLSPWEGHTSILAVVTYIAYFTDLPYGQAFLWMDAVCGSLFVWVWLSFVWSWLKEAGWRLILGLAGITAPFMLIYFGHIESYAPVFLFFLIWLTTAVRYTQNRKRIWLWSLVPLLLLCIKLHPVALLFTPALGLLFLDHYAHDQKWTASVLSWRGIALWILVPVFVVGAILYFFVFEDYQDPRSLNQKAMEFDRLFLPLLSPEAPLDKYNLLSFNHIFDYVSEWLIWSPVAVFLALAVVLFARKQLRFDSLPFRITGLSLILFGSLFFGINPLLSMQLDWDLMAIPAPVFLVLLVVGIRTIEGSRLVDRVWPTAIGLVLLCIPSFLIHTNTQAVSHRLESLGIRMYHTYYEWSEKVLQHALTLPDYPSRAAYMQRKQGVLDQLQPYAIPGKDVAYAYLLVEEGKYYLRVAKDYAQALQFLKQAEVYAPRAKNGLLYLMETHFLRKEYREAFQYSQQLVEIQYPSEQKAMMIAIQCAVEAGMYAEALLLSTAYLKSWPDNEDIAETYQRLTKRGNLDSLKYLFDRPAD